MTIRLTKRLVMVNWLPLTTRSLKSCHLSVSSLQFWLTIKPVKRVYTGKGRSTPISGGCRTLIYPWSSKCLSIDRFEELVDRPEGWLIKQFSIHSTDLFFQSTNQSKAQIFSKVNRSSILPHSVDWPERLINFSIFIGPHISNDFTIAHLKWLGSVRNNFWNLGT